MAEQNTTEEGKGLSKFSIFIIIFLFLAGIILGAIIIKGSYGDIKSYIADFKTQSQGLIPGMSLSKELVQEISAIKINDECSGVGCMLFCQKDYNRQKCIDWCVNNQDKCNKIIEEAKKSNITGETIFPAENQS